MKYLGVAFLVLAMLWTPPASAEAQAGRFDYYLLNLSWQPEFCNASQNQHKDECQTKDRGFVVHGLWPQYEHGYPEHCSARRDYEAAKRSLDIMPSVWLAQHEWSAHGGCSGLSEDRYFDLIRQAVATINIPTILDKAERSFSIAPAKIKQAFILANPDLRREDIAISCGNNNLTAVMFCMSKDDLTLRACSGVRDCHANVVKIKPIN